MCYVALTSIHSSSSSQGCTLSRLLGHSGSSVETKRVEAKSQLTQLSTVLCRKFTLSSPFLRLRSDLETALEAGGAPQPNKLKTNKKRYGYIYLYSLAI